MCRNELKLLKIKKYTMTFSNYQGGVVVSEHRDTHTHTQTPTNIHASDHILDICPLILCHFYSLSQLPHVIASLSSSGDNHQSTIGRSERTQRQAKIATWNIQLHAPGLSTPFDLSCIVEQPPPSFLGCPRPPTPFIEPNLCLPCNHLPLTSTINTLLAKWYSSILSICPYHLNTLWSALLNTL